MFSFCSFTSLNKLFYHFLDQKLNISQASITPVTLHMGHASSSSTHLQVPLQQRNDNVSFVSPSGANLSSDYLSANRLNFKIPTYSDKSKSCDFCQGTTAVISWSNIDAINTPKRRMCMNCIYAMMGK